MNFPALTFLLFLFASPVYAKVVGSIQKFTTPQLLSKSDPADQYYLKVHFGRLNAEDFEFLKTKYGGFSKVEHLADKEYSIEDFLPPAMQALINQTFEEIYHDVSFADHVEASSEEDEMTFFAFRKQGLGSFTNCWGTTLEVLRSMHADFNGVLNLYWPGRWEAGDIFERDEHSRALDEAEELRFGDVVAYRLKNLASPEFSSLQHTVIYLGDGLIFEKVDGRSTDPYRIAHLEDVTAKYQRLLEEDLVIHRRRVLGEGKVIFPTFEPAQDLFSADVAEVVKANLPQIDIRNITLGCEDRMGGGCDPVHTVAISTKLIQYKASGRGILSAPQSVLQRFKALDGKPDSEAKEFCAELLSGPAIK